jgi:hypothetical protein
MVGNVDIDLTEPTWDSTGSTQALNIVPGREISKDPQVANAGANDCYVRLVLTSEDITTAAMWNAVISEVMQGQDTTNWTWEVDGTTLYAYYNSILNPLGTTGAAFSGMKIDEAATEADITNIFGTDGDLDLVVTAQAIQAEGFTAPTDLAGYQVIFNGKTFVANP